MLKSEANFCGLYTPFYGKPEWATVAPYCKELKVYWHQWDTIEIKDGILCKKYIGADGTGADYLHNVPVSLRKEILSICMNTLQEDILVGEKLTTNSKSVFIGATCIKMFRSGAEFALHVVQENSHQEKQKAL